MDDAKSPEEQAQQAITDAKNGSLPDPNGGIYYLNAYNAYKANNPPPDMSAPPTDTN